MNDNTASNQPGYGMPDGGPHGAPNGIIPDGNTSSAMNPVTDVPAAMSTLPSDLGQSAVASAALNLSAADVDLIEKEWVQRAKAIVEHTKNDPYRQSAEISKVKAEYIKKRYNRDLPVSEE